MFINKIAAFLFCSFVCSIVSAQEVTDTSEQTPDPSDPGHLLLQIDERLLRSLIWRRKFRLEQT